MQRKKADYLVRFTLLVVIHCNFDIYRFESEIGREEKVSQFTTKFYTVLLGQEIEYTILPHAPEMDITIKIDKSKDKLTFKEYYKVPCFVTKKELKKLFKEKSFGSLNLDLEND